MKRVVTLVKIQSPKEASHHLNFDGQIPKVLFTCLCLCVRTLRVVAMA